MQLRITGIDTDTCVRQALEFGLLKQNVDFITIFYKQREMGKYVFQNLNWVSGGVCVCVCCWGGGGEGGQSNQRLRLAVVSDQLTNTFPKDNDNQNNFPYNIGVDRVA